MAMTSPRPPSLPAVPRASLAPSRPRLLLLSSAALMVGLLHCTNGTTPNCAPLDAGCGAGDTGAAGDAADAGDAAPDAVGDAAGGGG